MNGIVECRNVVLLNRARAVMYPANFTEGTRKKLWTETISYTENIRGSMAISRKTKNMSGLFFGRKVSFLNHIVELVGLIMLRKKRIFG